MKHMIHNSDMYYIKITFSSCKIYISYHMFYDIYWKIIILLVTTAECNFICNII